MLTLNLPQPLAITATITLTLTFKPNPNLIVYWFLCNIPADRVFIIENDSLIYIQQNLRCYSENKYAERGLKEAFRAFSICIIYWFKMNINSTELHWICNIICVLNIIVKLLYHSYYMDLNTGLISLRSRI